MCGDLFSPDCTNKLLFNYFSYFYGSNRRFSYIFIIYRYPAGEACDRRRVDYDIS